MDIKPNRPIRVGNKMMRTGADQGNLLANIDAAREDLAAEEDSDLVRLRAIVAEMLGDIATAVKDRIDGIETQLRNITESDAATKSERSVLASAVNDLGGEVSSLRLEIDKIKQAAAAEKPAVSADKAAKTPKSE